MAVNRNFAHSISTCTYTGKMPMKLSMGCVYINGILTSLLSHGCMSLCILIGQLSTDWSQATQGQVNSKSSQWDSKVVSTPGRTEPVWGQG